jgi:signal peptidase II
VEEAQRLLRVALSLVLAGAVGNFIDRLARGYVVDFVDWHWWNRPDLYWPTFNVADSMIVVGVGLLLLLPAPGGERAAARE